MSRTPIPLELAMRVEQASLAAWPAFETARDGDWLLRFADGYTKRANSVTVLGESAIAARRGLDAAIDQAERWFRERGVRPVFRLPSLGAIDALETALVTRRYTVLHPTIVMTREIGPGARADERAADALDEIGRRDVDDWLRVFDRTSGWGGAGAATHARILRSITADTAFATRAAGALEVACGLGVRDGALLGIFDVATLEAERRRGHGEAMVEWLEAWGASLGATTAYLQVVAANAPAVALYTKRGYVPAYRYHYRVGVETVSTRTK